VSIWGAIETFGKTVEAAVQRPTSPLLADQWLNAVPARNPALHSGINRGSLRRGGCHAYIKKCIVSFRPKDTIEYNPLARRKATPGPLLLEQHPIEIPDRGDVPPLVRGSCHTHSDGFVKGQSVRAGVLHVSERSGSGSEFASGGLAARPEAQRAGVAADVEQIDVGSEG
jgi:hypothetical protein